ncbi:hypothetical protein HWV62_45456 [Athelia sp. TMB]|nr:hypothetical protein HWV62_45456 [Athelia sp. TMB]
MPDAFFASTKPRKRKRSASAHDPAAGSSKKFAKKDGAKPRPGAPVKKKGRADEELDSDRTDEDAGIDDMDLRHGMDEGEEGSGEEDQAETPAEKRLRLAQLYLDSVKEGLADGEFDAAEIDKELIATRLKQDVLEHSGKVHIFVADTFDLTQAPTTVLRTRGHRLSVTSAVASESCSHLFTSGKEGSIIKWDLSNGKKLATYHKLRPEKKTKGKGKERAEAPGHTDEVLALALSGDGKYLASGGKDRRVGIWDVEDDKWVKGFGGHKDTVSALAFRKGTQQLYSGSFDRTLRLHDLSVMGFVETLFGHQDTVLGLDALRGETAISVGARDKTVRFWKIVDESQLVFRGGGRSAVRELLDSGAFDAPGPMDEDNAEGSGRIRTKKFVEGSIECVAMIDEATFVSGGDSGSICLWNTQKKKPVFTQALAHGFNQVHSETEGLIETPRWITAIASLRYSDLFASGSWEGTVRLWKLDPKLKSFSLMGTVPALGVANSLQLLPIPGDALTTASWTAVSDKPKRGAKVTSVLLVAGMGQEHRLGRWMKVKEEGAVNGTVVVALHPRTSD